MAANNNIEKLGEELSKSLKRVEKDLKTILEITRGKRLTIDETIQKDTYLAYLISSLYWMYLKLQGCDTSQHHIKHDLQRIKSMMTRTKDIEANASRLTMNIPATKRFIAAGLGKRRIAAGDEEPTTSNKSKKSSAK